MDNKFEKFSDWDLVNSFISSTWMWKALRERPDPRNRDAYEEWLAQYRRLEKQVNAFRAELMSRLAARPGATIP